MTNKELLNTAIVLHGGAMSKAETEGVPLGAAMSEALQSGWDSLMRGAPAEEAAVAAVKVLESSGLFDAGRGAFPNVVGEAALDVGLMRGDGKFCAVAGIPCMAHPSELALDLFREGDSRFWFWNPEFDRRIAALDSAARLRYGIVKNSSELISAQALRAADLARQEDQARQAKSLGSSAQKGPGRTNGTVGCVARDSGGNIAALTSTGGTMFKPIGRIGDSPIIGAGVFADSEWCGLSATGHGEAILRSLISPSVVCRVRSEIENNAAAFEHAPGRLKTLIRSELGLLARRSPGSVGGLIVMPSRGAPAAEFSSAAMPVAFRYFDGEGEKSYAGVMQPGLK